MKPELQEKLFAIAPEWFIRDDLQTSLMAFGFSVDDGWYRILEAGLHRLRNWIHEGYDSTWPDGKYPYEFEVVQVKEKFGGLRFYAHGADQVAQNIIDGMEFASTVICEKCGASGNLRTDGWYRTLCDVCQEERAHGRKEPEQATQETQEEEASNGQQD